MKKFAIYGAALVLAVIVTTFTVYFTNTGGLPLKALETKACTLLIDDNCSNQTISIQNFLVDFSFWFVLFLIFIRFGEFIKSLGKKGKHSSQN